MYNDQFILKEVIDFIAKTSFGVIVGGCNFVFRDSPVVIIDL